ncbi:class F sortase [Asanoa siamensis]|uniref:Class F sortase n=1 Tax=Asanoa siamensis TaxID=926357 RepID=A0ABQ4CNG5_9ACTN|nr:class F sortase [Asanoa siamensis]GIF72827.1 class F sortase [Asanoa siamensis]
MGRADLLWRAVAVLAALLVGGSTLTASAPRAEPVPAAPPGPLAVDSFRSARSYAAVAAPVRLRIPAAGIDTALGSLGRNPDGTVEVPTDPAEAGWFAEGPRPGQPGPAVILGHVDSRTGPAVFYALPTLRPGTLVTIDLSDGTGVAFRVAGQQRVAKTSFPTDEVYAPTLRPSLRLITCGGTFDHTSRHYRDNVIVYADPA